MIPYFREGCLCIIRILVQDISHLIDIDPFPVRRLYDILWVRCPSLALCLLHSFDQLPILTVLAHEETHIKSCEVEARSEARSPNITGGFSVNGKLH